MGNAKSVDDNRQKQGWTAPTTAYKTMRVTQKRDLCPTTDASRVGERVSSQDKLIRRSRNAVAFTGTTVRRIAVIRSIRPPS